MKMNRAAVLGYMSYTRVSSRRGNPKHPFEINMCIFHSIRVCMCVDMTYSAFKKQAPARRVTHSLVIPLYQLSTAEQAYSWE